MRVAVAMSGGVDSTISALLLGRMGYEVIGLHMCLHPESHRAWHCAQKAAEELGVPIHHVDFSREFGELVLAPFVAAYAAGRTPSPCPLCNRVMKTTLLFQRALQFGCEKLATGHYARVEQAGDEWVLRQAVDRSKDQSYFLFMLTQQILERTLFPLGALSKATVREIAGQEGLSVGLSAESQELCFIPDGDYRQFLRKHGVQERPGPIVDSSGKVLGRHSGIDVYTVGQRRRLGICGRKPLYVIRIDPDNDTVVVGTKEQTYSSGFRMTGVNFVRPAHPVSGEEFSVKVRSTARPMPCRVAGVTSDALEITFRDPQSAVAPGQAAVLYSGDRLAGGGWIEETWL